MYRESQHYLASIRFPTLWGSLYIHKVKVERPFLVIDIPRFAVTGHMLTGNVAFLDQLLTAYS